ncbi:hypothetical protein [Bacteroides sp. 519]|uniref:hypothetical protein n=1 Tax=Bacteroides sp. 519 TaxID=2302937 RepID=UPI0013D79161|nr:hypothetical protein [Bacteroides sp. 519]NDV60557.1 hypothetical protein [Bacteroides sp. 519]
MKIYYLFLLLFLCACSTSKSVKQVNTEVLQQQKAYPKYPGGEDSTNSHEIYELVFPLPQYPGGMNNLKKHIRKSVSYPFPVRLGKKGDAIVQFEINRYGEMTKAVMIKGLSKQCNRKIIKALEMMRKWISGSARGPNENTIWEMTLSFGFNRKPKFVSCELVDNDSLMLSLYESDSIYTAVTNVSDIPTMSISDWENLLDKHDLILNKDSEYLNVAVKKSPYFMQSALLGFDKEIQKQKNEKGKTEYGSIQINKKKYNTIDYTDQYSINYIKLKGDKYILCLIGDQNIYKIIPDKSFFNNRLSTVKVEKELERTKIAEYSAKKEYAYFNIEHSMNGKYTIVNNANMPLGIEGDIIVGHQGPTAVYRKDKDNYELYDAFLNKVEHKYKIQYAQLGYGNWLTLIIDNNLTWMVADKISKENIRTLPMFGVCGTVSYYEDEVVYIDGDIKIKRIEDHQRLGKGVEYFDFDITNTQHIDSLYFYGTKTQQYYSANEFYPYNVTLNGVQFRHLLYAKMKNGKYNIYAYKEKHRSIYKQTEETFKSTLDVELGNGEPAKTYYSGEIELIPLLVSDVDSVSMHSYPIIYKDNELYGVYNVNKKARYSELKKINYEKIMRFKLPDGKQGWLDWSNGKEIIDKNY